MISMRYHIVSLAAIFLALALGIVLGATKISSPILAGLQSDKTDLSSQNDTLSSDNSSLTARVSSDDKFATSVANLSVRGTLPNSTVVLITTADADPSDRDAVLSLLDRAGAKVTAQIQLTPTSPTPATPTSCGRCRPGCCQRAPNCRPFRRSVRWPADFSDRLC